MLLYFPNDGRGRRRAYKALRLCGGWVVDQGPGYSLVYTDEEETAIWAIQPLLVGEDVSDVAAVVRSNLLQQATRCHVLDREYAQYVLAYERYCGEAVDACPHRRHRTAKAAAACAERLRRAYARREAKRACDEYYYL